MRKGTRFRTRLLVLLLFGTVIALLIGALIATPAMPTRSAPPGIPYTWGANGNGQLANGTTSNSVVPVQVASSPVIMAVAGGGWHSLALAANGHVWAAGFNGYGQLGNGTMSSSNTPVQVASLSSAIAIAGGGYHSLALIAGGAVVAWGGNTDGQLGDGTTSNSTTPVAVVGLPSAPIVAIAAGWRHSLALDANGNVWAWGFNGYGQLGDGTTISSATPVQVPFPAAIAITAIAAGYDHSLALDTNGNVWAWGDNIYGQLGDGTTTNSSTPVMVLSSSGGPLSGVTAIAGGGIHSLALDTNGNVWAWGANFYGALGNGSADFIPHPTPSPVGGLSGIVAIAGGGYHSLALDSSTQVWAWGWNSSGQLGDGTTTDSSTPVMVLSSGGSPLSGVSQIAAGTEHSLALAGATQPTPTPTPCVPTAAHPCQTPPATGTPCITIPGTVLCQTPTPTGTPCVPMAGTPCPTGTPCVPTAAHPCQTPTPTPTPCVPTAAHPCQTPTPTGTPCITIPGTVLCQTPSPTPSPTPTPTPTPTPVPCTQFPGALNCT